MRAALLSFAAAACFASPAFAQAAAGAPAPEYQAAHSAAPISDPAEGFNRSMYGVNDALDRVLLEPGARAYRAVTPSPLRAGVRNFLRNLRAPVIFANDVLQGEMNRAGATAGRFGVNSTLGFFGLIDVAEDMGLERHDEDFGQTLAVWGVGTGPYLYLPLLGPTNVRDGAGLIVDAAINPLTWAKFDGDDEFRATRIVFGALSTREELIEPIQSLRETSLDPYVSVRSTYALTRESAIRNGLQDVQDLPDFEPIPSEPAGTEEPPPPESVGEGEQGITP